MPVDSSLTEPVKQILGLFGVQVEYYLAAVAVLFPVVEGLKGFFPKFFTGWKTRVAMIVVSFGISAKLLLPDWEKVVVLTIATSLASNVAHLILKKRTNGNNS